MNKYFLLSLLCIVITSSVAQTSDNTYHFKYKKGKYYLLNPQKKKVDCEPFFYASKFNEGLAVVSNSLEFNYIDSTGQPAFSKEFYDAGPFIDGIAYAAIKGKYGFINKQGKFIIEPQFDFANSFKDGFAFVHMSNPDTIKFGNVPYLKGLISKEGQLLGDKYYSELYKSNEGEYYQAIKKDSLFHISMDGSCEFIELKGDSLFSIVSDMPEYPGGEMGLRRFIAMNVRYPVIAQEHGIQGRCYISFVIDEHGDVADIQPAMAAPPILIKESLRAVSVMPKWKPGRNDGKPVKVSYTVPVNYVLQ